MKKRTKLLIAIAITMIVIALSPTIYYAVCWQIYLMNPNIVEHKEKAYQKLSSEELIKKLGFWNVWWFDTALEILAERKEKDAVPHIIKLLKSSDKYKRDSAMRALAKIGDPSAIEPLMEIVKKGRNHPDYLDALDALANLHYENIYPEILQMAKDNFYTSWVVSMLKNFPDKPETLPTLQKIAQTDPKEYIRNKAKEVLARLSGVPK